MKIISRFFALLAAGLACCAPTAAAEKVLIYSAPGEAGVLSAALRQKGFEPMAVDSTALAKLDSKGSQLLVLAGGQPVNSAGRFAISRFLQAGGNAIVVGPRNFPGAPQPLRAVPLGDFSRDDTYQIVTPAREGSANGEKPRIEKATAPGGHAALRLSTSTRDMINIMAQFHAAPVRSPRRNLLTFQAKGDAYMDLLALEVTDTAGQKYFGFAPLSQQWKTHAISLADFIPAGWSDAQKPYPLLDPAKLETIALGTNRFTLWQEKPMDFSIAEVALAENPNREYAPTAALNRLRIPFQEIGIAAPAWVFDPFFGSQNMYSQAVLASRAAPSTPKGNARFRTQVWRLPPPYSEFPGTKMGTDNRAEYDTRPEQSLRRIALWETAAENNAPGETVAELRLFTGGVYQGAGVALFSFAPGVLQRQDALLASMAETAEYILRRPKIAQIEINTTAQAGNGDIAPVLKIALQNPLDKAVRGEIQVNVAGGKMRAKTEFSLPPRKLTTRTIELGAVPANFDFRNFAWEVTLSSASGNDIWRDSVDVERILLSAATHMVSAQKIFPDGRISHHYFADAYGARAMLAYLNFLQKNPEHLRRNRDLWRGLTTDEMRETALRFCDMMVRRQNPNGSVPMGYGEQSNSFNVADGGQISLGLGAMAYDINDPKRRAEYLQAARKIIDFAETFYIDEAKYARLQREDAEQLAKDKAVAGYYGLGVYSGGKRRESGPIWVLADLLATQALLSYAFPEAGYDKILERNVRLYLDRVREEEGWYQGEAMIWAYLALPDEKLRRRLADAFRNSFLRPMYSGKENDMYDAGSRGTLRALPLAYSRRLWGDSPGQRAALLKYVWTAGSETSSGSVRRLAEAYPNPHHGASISAIKFSQFSAIWAMELLAPNSTLLQAENFPRVKADQRSPFAALAGAQHAAPLRNRSFFSFLP